jgi:hypothetical protein
MSRAPLEETAQIRLGEHFFMHTARRLFRTFLLGVALMTATGCGTSTASSGASRGGPGTSVGTGMDDATTGSTGGDGMPFSGSDASGAPSTGESGTPSRGSDASGAPAPGEGAEAGISSEDAGLPPVTTAPAIGNRQDIDFNLDWKFNSGDVTGADAAAFADSAWSYVDLPHTTKFVTPEDPLALLGISWYRKHFTMAASQKGMKVFLEFGAAMQLADVWVNGTHMIQHEGGYTPFTIDITNAVTYGGTDNVVAVKLDNDANAAFPPGKADVDFEYYGGLYRKVTLHVTDPLHVTDAVFAGKAAGGGVFVTYPAVSATAATVAVQTDVINESTAAKTAGVQSQILDANGNVVGSATSSAMIAAGADSAVSQMISLTNPHLWHPNTPYLYTLRTTVLDGTTAVDGVTTGVVPFLSVPRAAA